VLWEKRDIFNLTSWISNHILFFVYSPYIIKIDKVMAAGQKGEIQTGMKINYAVLTSVVFASDANPLLP
jgi:hypothetical protein